MWLNNPLRPYEACGTSGMKAALNGAANLSILDGWWDEWFDPAFGWEIPSAEATGDPERRDDLEAKAIYDIIENEIVPRFYDVDHHGLPQRWIQMIRDTIAGLGPKVLASRMVRDYVTTSTHRQRHPPMRSTNPQAAPAALAQWKRRCGPPGRASGSTTWSRWTATRSRWAPRSTSVRLVRAGELSPDDIEVQLVTGRVSVDDRLYEPRVNPFPDRRRRGRWTAPLRRLGGGQACRCDRLPVRVVPYHPLLASPAEMGLAALPANLPTPPSAGYRG